MSFNVRDLLSPEELARFTTKSDPQGARAFAVAWLSIIVSFAIPAIWPNPLTVILAIILLGGCQQSVGVLMHECGHNTLFKTPALNRWFGTWLASAPIFSDLQTYARGHMGHHKYAGTEQDPDKSNYQAYPVSKASFRRKVIRDLTGQTGLKLVLGGLKQRDALQADNVLVFPLRSWLVNGLMLAVLVAIGQGWLYLLWLTAFLTTYMLCLRLRQVAEHAGVPDLLDPDPRQTYPNNLPQSCDEPFPGLPRRELSPGASSAAGGAELSLAGVASVFERAGRLRRGEDCAELYRCLSVGDFLKLNPHIPQSNHHPVKNTCQLRVFDFKLLNGQVELIGEGLVLILIFRVINLLFDISQ